MDMSTEGTYLYGYEHCRNTFISGISENGPKTVSAGTQYLFDGNYCLYLENNLIEHYLRRSNIKTILEEKRHVVLKERHPKIQFFRRV
jgi:hypothetical protein